MSERITIWRAPTDTDEDGNPIHGAPVAWKSFQALVAPVQADEQPSESTPANAVTWTHTIYIRSLEPSGVRASDIVEVRGRLVPVTGTPSVWQNVAGTHVGDVIHVTLPGTTDEGGESS